MIATTPGISIIAARQSNPVMPVISHYSANAEDSKNTKHMAGMPALTSCNHFLEFLQTCHKTVDSSALHDAPQSHTATAYPIHKLGTRTKDPADTRRAHLNRASVDRWSTAF